MSTNDTTEPLTSFNWEPEPFVRAVGTHTLVSLGNVAGDRLCAEQRICADSFDWGAIWEVVADQHSRFEGEIKHVAAQFRRRSAE